MALDNFKVFQTMTYVRKLDPVLELNFTHLVKKNKVTKFLCSEKVLLYKLLSIFQDHAR